MTMKTVLLLMAAAGLLVAGWTFRLHERFLSADEAETRHACRVLCKLGLMDFAAGAGGDAGAGMLGDMARSLAGRACEVMDDGTPLLLECRDRMTGAGLTVAEYRCIAAAPTSGDARACSDAVR